MKAKLLITLLLGSFIVGCSADPIEEEILNSQVTTANTHISDEEYGCAGPDNSRSIQISEAAALESWDDVRKLYLSLLPAGVDKNGTFDPTIWDLIEAFDNAADPIGSYTTTYTVNASGCSDSVVLTIEVVPDLSDPVCDLSAGADNTRDLQISEAAALESWDEVRKLFISLLDPSVSTNGTFDPSIWDLINAFNSAADPIGTYTTTYTITEGDCTDSVELTINVIPDFSDVPECTLDAGSDKVKEISKSTATALESWDEVRKLYLSLLDSGVSRDGSFDPSIWDLINAFNTSDDNLGDYTTTYTITEGDCTDSVRLTIRVVED